VLKDGHLKMIYGTQGGETIGQTQFQVLVNVIDFGMGSQEAIEAPRVRVDAEPSFYKPGAALTLAMEARVAKGALEQLDGPRHRDAAGVHHRRASIANCQIAIRGIHWGIDRWRIAAFVIVLLDHWPRHSVMNWSAKRWIRIRSSCGRSPRRPCRNCRHGLLTTPQAFAANHTSLGQMGQ
jgi:hypothetical protein